MDILAIDPGNVTGVAWWHHSDFKVRAEIERGLYGFVDWWRSNVGGLGWPEPDLVLIEDFIIRADTHRKTREPAAYELLGWVKGKCHEAGIPIDVIGPSEHSGFSAYKTKKTSKLVRLGWHIPSKDMHYDSAASILLTGMKRHDRLTATALLKEIAQ